MPPTLGKMQEANINPVLVENIRGGICESFHRGVVCVVNEHNEIIYEIGNSQQVCFPRSALKFFQQIPLITSGAFDHFQFTLKELAVMCGSHNGEAMHVETVQSILKKINCSEADLQCGAQMPTLKKDAHILIKNNEQPQAIHNNCSGKHAGFLAWCKFHSISHENYLEEHHPLHIEIKKVVAQFYNIPENSIVCGIDGCSAPIFAMPVYNQALAYKNLVAPEHFNNDAISRACNLIVKAVGQFPEMIAGSQRYCTDLMAVTKSAIIGKTGADGVYSIAIPEKKLGISIKIDDGRMGPQYNVAQKILEILELISHDESEKLQHYLHVQNINFGGKNVGPTQTVNRNYPIPQSI